MNAICLAVDGLHVGYLGAYGNCWIKTPALDRLALEGFVFDQFLIDSPDLGTLYRSYWQMTHALAGPRSPGMPPHLGRLLAAQGVSAVLMTDEPALAANLLAAGFEPVIRLPAPQQTAVADRPDKTHLFGSFAHLVQWLASAREPFCVWCHLSGLAAPWDGPMDLRRAYMEPGDPEPPQTAEVPNRILPADYDPDELLGICQAYAGQVTLLDRCVGALMELVDREGLGSQTLLAVFGVRGFPLGEHRRVGLCDEPLYSELVHVPLILRFPGGLGAAGRSQALVQPADLGATLADFWGIPLERTPGDGRTLLPLVREEIETARDRACIVGRSPDRAIATPVWYLRVAEREELFLRPDDRWQVNDVADRCPEVVELLRAAFDHYSQALQSGQISQIPPLDDLVLVRPD
ncbi:MAG: sulfatase family protein [Thermoguttaceae bacterium]